MQYELILVFEHAHRNPQLDRNTRLALDIPTSMTLEEREHLFVVWNRLAEQYTAFDLSGLPAGVRQCLFDARACAESANLLGLVILLYELQSRIGAGGSEKGSRRAMPVR